MRYVLARLEENMREDMYRIYVTDTMYLNGENKRFNYRFIDIINGKVKLPDQRSGDEIAEDVFKRAGITLGE